MSNNKSNPGSKNLPGLQVALIQSILESSPDGILVVDENGTVKFYNRKFFDVWMLPNKIDPIKSMPEYVIGGDDTPLLKAVTQLVSDPKAFVDRVQELYENPQLVDYCEIKLKDERILERHSSVLWGDERQYLGRVWFFRDITAHKKIESDLEELTHLDPLTGIANRRYFFERASLEYARSKRYLTPLCIASMDIDHFKLVNDNHGHAAGDEVIKMLCSISQGMLRETELLARIGGEEFAILMPNTKLDGASHLGDRLRQVIADHQLTYEGQEISISVSIGIAELSPKDSSIEDCLRKADKAMYMAKENGRNRMEIFTETCSE